MAEAPLIFQGSNNSVSSSSGREAPLIFQSSSNTPRPTAQPTFQPSQSNSGQNKASGGIFHDIANFFTATVPQFLSHEYNDPNSLLNKTLGSKYSGLSNYPDQNQVTFKNTARNVMENTDPALGLIGKAQEIPSIFNAVKGAVGGVIVGSGLQAAAGQSLEDIKNSAPMNALFGAAFGGHDGEVTPTHQIDGTVKVVDFLKDSGITENLNKESPKIAENFVQKVVDRYGMADKVPLYPQDIQTKVFTDSPHTETQFLKDAGIAKNEWDSALQSGGTVEIPTTKVAELSTKPYWEDLKTTFDKPIPEGGLTPYDTPAVIAERQRLQNVESTHAINTPERVALREKITNELYGNGAQNKDKRLDIVMGPPAAGKSTVMVEPLAKEHGSLVVDADMAKAKLPEYAGGKNANAVHVESSDIAEFGLVKKAVANGDNIVMPLVGKNLDKMKAIIQGFKQQGYDVHLHLNDLSPDIAAQRAVKRFEDTGRFVDPNYILHDVGLKPRENFDILKTDKGVNSYEKLSNNVPEGQAPKLIERSRGSENGQRPESPQSTQSTQTNSKSQIVEKEKTQINQSPNGQGQVKNSRLYERVKEQLGDDLTQKEVQYNTLNLDEQAKQVAETIQSDPAKAMNIARGLEEAPVGTTQNAFSVGLAELARQKGDFETMASLLSKTSLRSTRYGQELVTLRGHFDETQPLNYIHKIINDRKAALVSRYSKAIESIGVEKGATIDSKASSFLDHQVSKAKVEIKGKEAMIQSITSVLDGITCK